MRQHLAIFKKGLGEMILNGEKTIESRFSKTRMAPFEVVSVGDQVYIKVSGREIIGQFSVKKVISFEGLDEGDLAQIKQFYGQDIAADEGFWQRHQNAKYGTLIFVGATNRFITSPIRVPKKDQRAWMVLG